MTLGNAAAAHVRLIVWCMDCRHQVEPDPAEMATRYGAETTLPDLARAARVLKLREPKRGHGGDGYRAAMIAPYRRGRPARGARLGLRSSAVTGLAGGGSRGAPGSFPRMARRVLMRGDSGNRSSAIVRFSSRRSAAASSSVSSRCMA
jgi:hypothetical protein